MRIFVTISGGWHQPQVNRQRTCPAEGLVSPGTREEYKFSGRRPPGMRYKGSTGSRPTHRINGPLHVQDTICHVRSHSTAQWPRGWRLSRVVGVSVKTLHQPRVELAGVQRARAGRGRRTRRTPLLERVKFLSIFSSNLDEFFMVRVAGLRRAGLWRRRPQDLNPRRLAGHRSVAARSAVARRNWWHAQYRCLNDERHSAARETRDSHRRFLRSQEERESLDEFFRTMVFPILTPMAIDPSHPRPRYHNRGLYLADALAAT